jgi:hypothetical protein
VRGDFQGGRFPILNTHISWLVDYFESAMIRRRNVTTLWTGYVIRVFIRIRFVGVILEFGAALWTLKMKCFGVRQSVSSTSKRQ